MNQQEGKFLCMIAHEFNILEYLWFGIYVSRIIYLLWNKFVERTSARPQACMFKGEWYATVFYMAME